MRVESADDVANDAGRLFERGFRVELQQAHRVQDTPVDGLQSVAGIGQCPLRDGREGIGEITLGQRFIEGFFENLSAIRRD